MNISNFTSTFINGNITGKIFDSFKNRKFFDNSVLNKINAMNENGNQSMNQSNQGFESVTNKNVGNIIFILKYKKCLINILKNFLKLIR
jgi:hypothetical protein